MERSWHPKHSKTTKQRSHFITTKKLNIDKMINVEKTTASAKLLNPQFGTFSQILSHVRLFVCVCVCVCLCVNMCVPPSSLQLNGFGLSTLAGIDPNVNNFVSAAVISTTNVLIGCLLRLEPNMDTKVQEPSHIYIYMIIHVHGGEGRGGEGRGGEGRGGEGRGGEGRGGEGRGGEGRGGEGRGGEGRGGEGRGGEGRGGEGRGGEGRGGEGRGGEGRGGEGRGGEGRGGEGRGGEGRGGEGGGGEGGRGEEGR